MLVISRKVGETLVISDHIKITVMACGNDKVSLGIEAPREIAIVREELLDTIEANKSSVVQTTETVYKDLAALIKQNKEIDKK